MTRETAFFKGWSWFKVNNSGLALVPKLKFHSSVAKELKLEVRKFWGVISTAVELTGEKLVGGRGLLKEYSLHRKNPELSNICK